MKELLFKLLLVPFVAFGLMMLTAAIMGTFYSTPELRELLGGTSALPIYYGWLAILYPIVIAYYIYKKIQLKKLK
jgi:uncharacterized membrane protein YqjE